MPNLAPAENPSPLSLFLSLSQPFQDPRNRNPDREISRDCLMQFGGFEFLKRGKKGGIVRFLFGNGGSKASGRIRGFEKREIIV